MVNFYPNAVLHMPFSRSLRSCEKGGWFLHFWAAKPPKNAKTIFFGDFLLRDAHNPTLALYYLHVTELGVICANTKISNG